MKTKNTFSNKQVYLHTCGEEIEVLEHYGNFSYRDMEGHIITVCPGCLRDIELQDLSQEERTWNE